MSLLPMLQNVIAQEGGAGGASGGILAIVAQVAIIIGIFYFLLIRPQQKKEAQRKQMLEAIKHDDEIITTSGILGRVTALAEHVVTIEIAPNVRVKMLRSAIAGPRAKEAKE